MDATLKLKAEQLAGEIASQAQTLDDVNGLLRVLMKSALERMLDTEMDGASGPHHERNLAGKPRPEWNQGTVWAGKPPQWTLQEDD